MYYEEFRLDFSQNDTVSLCIENMTLEGTILEIREHSIRFQSEGEPEGPRSLDLARIWSCRKIAALTHVAIPARTVALTTVSPSAPDEKNTPDSDAGPSGADAFAALKEKVSRFFSDESDVFQFPVGPSIGSYRQEKKLKELLATARNRVRSALEKKDSSAIQRSVEELDGFLKLVPAAYPARRALTMLELFDKLPAERFDKLHAYFAIPNATIEGVWNVYAFAAYESGNIERFMQVASRYAKSETVTDSIRALKSAPVPAVLPQTKVTVPVPQSTDPIFELQEPKSTLPSPDAQKVLASLKEREKAFFADAAAIFQYPSGYSSGDIAADEQLRALLYKAHGSFNAAREQNDISGIYMVSDGLTRFLKSHPSAILARKALLLIKICRAAPATKFRELHDYFLRSGVEPDEFWESYALAAYENGTKDLFAEVASRFPNSVKARETLKALKDIPACAASPNRKPVVLAVTKSAMPEAKVGTVVRSAVKVEPLEMTAFNEANTLVQEGRKAEAVELLAPKVLEYPKSVRLWTIYAQQLSALRRFDEAISAFEHLSKIADGMAKNHYESQVVILNRRKNMLVPSKAEAFSLDLDVLQKVEDSVSVFLSREVEDSSFTDPKILENNNKVTPSDAQRLLEKAKDSKNLVAHSRDKAYFSRYPLFREAAKAFSLLPNRTPEQEKAYRFGISYYAMQRAGSIVAEMRRVFGTPTVNSSHELAVLCDSALSYYTEGMKLLAPNEQLSYIMLPSLTSYLEACLLSFFRNARTSFIKLFGNENDTKTFKELICHALSSGNEELYSIIWEAMLAWRRNPQLWKRILDMDANVDGPRKIFGYIQKYPEALEHFRASMLKELGPGRSKDSPQILYVATAEKRADDYARLESYFDEMKDLEVDGFYTYFTELLERFEFFPRDTKALFSSDREAFRELVEIISTFHSYEKASEYARGDMLVNARLKLSNSVSRAKGLKDRIILNTSYWKRVALLPIIENCLKNIEFMEATRQNARQPKLHISLEPGSFHRKGDSLSTTLRMRNSGPADAVDVSVFINLQSGDGKNEVRTLFEENFNVLSVPSEQHVDHDLDIPVDIIGEDPDAKLGDLSLFITAATGTPYAASASFCFDVDSGQAFYEEEIPWVVGSMPQKLFGREMLLANLKSYLGKQHRTFTHMLFGVTRSGKSSILKFLREDINGMLLPEDELRRRVFCIEWRFNDISSVGITPADLWATLLEEGMEEAASAYIKDNEVKRESVQAGLGDFDAENTAAEVQEFVAPPCSKASWLRLVDDMNEAGLYPVFLIDEFTNYKDLFDQNLVGRDFLSSMRDMALGGKATFFVAGTYDIKDLITDDKYGITGQFVNLRKHRVTSIEAEPARDLVNCFDKLRFSGEAQDMIVSYADRRPYLIQIICSNCAQYALVAGRSILGISEVERVIRVLTTNNDEEKLIGVNRLDDLAFNKNLIFKNEDPNNTLDAVIALLCHEGRDGFLSYETLHKRWLRAGLRSSDLSHAIEMLEDREVIAKKDDEGIKGYAMRVPLFLRWWKNKHDNLTQVLKSVICREGDL